MPLIEKEDLDNFLKSYDDIMYIARKVMIHQIAIAHDIVPGPNDEFEEFEFDIQEKEVISVYYHADGYGGMDRYDTRYSISILLDDNEMDRIEEQYYKIKRQKEDARLKSRREYLERELDSYKQGCERVKAELERLK